MNTRHFFSRTVPALLLGSALAVGALGCDGAMDATTSSTAHALTAELDEAQPVMGFDVAIRVSEPTSPDVDHFVQAQRHAEETTTIDTAFEFIPGFRQAVDLSNIHESFVATAQAIAGNEYVGERQVSEKVNEPIYSTIPIGICKGVYPCDVVVRLEVERVDFSEVAVLDVDWVAWAQAGAFDVEIVDVNRADDR